MKVLFWVMLPTLPGEVIVSVVAVVFSQFQRADSLANSIEK